MTQAVEELAAEETTDEAKMVSHIVCPFCYPEWYIAAPFTLKGICGTLVLGAPAGPDSPHCRRCDREREEHFFEHWCEEKEL
jgi:hypothetical protein